MVRLVSEVPKENRSRNTESDRCGFRICGRTKRYDFHAVNEMKPILSVSCLCEQGVEIH